MAERIGLNTVVLHSRPRISAFAAVGGAMEAGGLLNGKLARVFDDDTLGQDSWEKAEAILQQAAAESALYRARLSTKDVDLHFAGDLLGQCSASMFGSRGLGIPFAGLYGACSTMALSLASAAIAIESGAARTALAGTSSHFCAAEKQFRQPLEYGGQRPPTAQWTATAAGACLLQGGELQGDVLPPIITQICLGSVTDLGIKDAHNMGAAMAPAAANTIGAFLRDTQSIPGDYDLILTGDLGSVGSDLLRQLLLQDWGVDLSDRHNDCGLMLYSQEQPNEINAGASGCGCSAAVLCGDILPRIAAGELRRVLFIATGALLSSVSSLQGESIPAIAHAVLIESGT
ncbi:MAG: stage V sporulation protein AD [Oscillospiraceae bacterium]|jgi:stage V sporulation protein AD|nr:stage V sporulation protein AD [Oscillospiraceae bacterium]